MNAPFSWLLRSDIARIVCLGMVLSSAPCVAAATTPWRDEATCWAISEAEIGGDSRGVAILRDGSVVQVGSQRKHSYDRLVMAAKRDPSGNLIWARRCGWRDRDMANDVTATADGGFLVVDWTWSYGLVVERDPTKPKKYPQAWLLKFDAAGELEWHETHGGEADTNAFAAIEADDSGFLVVGTRRGGAKEKRGLWVLRTDARGRALWQRSYGAQGLKTGQDVAPSPTGGYMILGNNGRLLEISDDGELLRLRRFDKAEFPEFRRTPSVQSLAPDGRGGYVLAGSARDVGRKERHNVVAWAMRVDPALQIVWSRTFTGPEQAVAKAVTVDARGNSVLAGKAWRFGRKQQYWIAVVDRLGETLQERIMPYKGTAKAVAVSRHGEFYLTGQSDGFGSKGQFVVGTVQGAETP